MHSSVHCISTYSSQDMEATKVSTEEKDVVCVNITDYYSVIKEQNDAMCRNMNRSIDYHTK